MSSQSELGHCHFCYDVLLGILRFLSGDNDALYQCALVNREFNPAASSLMYARVKLSLPYPRVLDLKDRGELSVSRNSCYFYVHLIHASQMPSMFTSACTSRNALFVVDLEISGTWMHASLGHITVCFFRLLIDPAAPTEQVPKCAFERPTDVRESVQFHVDTFNISRRYICAIFFSA